MKPRDHAAIFSAVDVDVGAASQAQFLTRQAQVAKLTEFHDKCSNDQKTSMCLRTCEYCIVHSELI